MRRFAGVITTNILKVGGLLVSNAWIYGDVMDLEIRRQEAEVRGSEVRGQETVQIGRASCRERV